MDSEKFSYFMRRTEQDLNHIRARVDDLWDFKLKMIGIAAGVSGVFSLFVTLLTLYLRR